LRRQPALVNYIFNDRCDKNKHAVGAYSPVCRTYTLQRRRLKPFLSAIAVPGGSGFSREYILLFGLRATTSVDGDSIRQKVFPLCPGELFDTLA